MYFIPGIGSQQIFKTVFLKTDSFSNALYFIYLLKSIVNMLYFVFVFPFFKKISEYRYFLIVNKNWIKESGVDSFSNSRFLQQTSTPESLTITLLFVFNSRNYKSSGKSMPLLWIICISSSVLFVGVLSLYMRTKNYLHWYR